MARATILQLHGSKAFAAIQILLLAKASATPIGAFTPNPARVKKNRTSFNEIVKSLFDIYSLCTDMTANDQQLEMTNSHDLVLISD